MSDSSRVETTGAPWRKACAVFCVFAMMGGGMAFAAQAEPTSALDGVAASKGSPAIVVPNVALDIPSNRENRAPTRVSGHSFSNANLVVRAKSSGNPKPSPEPVTPVARRAATVLGSSIPVTLDSTGIPIPALEGYQLAASLVNAADPGCNLDWALLAAIGNVESNHARFGGNQLDSAGVAQPGIIGIPLDGTNGTARITDTDGGRLDRDSVYDRAVGPMQFIPSTWRIAGTDADGDGVKNPQDMADAAAASAIYLCSGPGDLSQPGDLHAAIMRYNASESYVRTVTGIASGYRHGVTALPVADRPARSSAASTSVAAAGPKAFEAKSTSTVRRPVSPSTITPTSSARKPAPTTSARPAVTRPTTAGTSTSTPAQSTPATPTKKPVAKLPEAENGRSAKKAEEKAREETSDNSGSEEKSDNSGSGHDLEDG